MHHLLALVSQLKVRYRLSLLGRERNKKKNVDRRCLFLRVCMVAGRSRRERESSSRTMWRPEQVCSMHLFLRYCVYSRGDDSVWAYMLVVLLSWAETPVCMYVYVCMLCMYDVLSFSDGNQVYDVFMYVMYVCMLCMYVCMYICML